MSSMQSTRRPQEGAESQQPPEEVVDRLAELLPEGALDEAVRGLRAEELGLQGRLELVRLIENGSSLRAAAAALSVAPATAHRWWHRWTAAGPAERSSRACLRARSTRPRSCPWALGEEAEQAILSAREKTNWGPMQLQFLCGRH